MKWNLLQISLKYFLGKPQIARFQTRKVEIHLYLKPAILELAGGGAV